MTYQTRKFYEDQGNLFLEGKLALEPSSDEIRNMVLRMFDKMHLGLVLNIGVGPKPFIDIELLKRGYSVIGIDISHSFLTVARKMLDQKGLDAKLVVSEAINLPFCADVFDLCLCSEVIEHVKDPEVLLEEISRVLKSSGKLILTTPSNIGLANVILITKHKLNKENKVDSNVSHVKEYTYGEIIRFSKNFFKLQAYYHTGAFPAERYSFLEAPIAKICNFIVNIPYLNRFSSTMGFIFEKVR